MIRIAGSLIMAYMFKFDNVSDNTHSKYVQMGSWKWECVKKMGGDRSLAKYGITTEHLTFNIEH